MAIPSFVPVISGSGFDGLAQQQAGWQGFNANVQRQNLDSFARANDARNNYFETVAQMQRADAQRQQASQDQADADAVKQYRFDVGTQLDKAQQDIERQKIAATSAAKDYTDARKQALADAKDNEAAADALASAGHFDTQEELNKALPNSTPLVKTALWDKNQQARQQLTQQYNFTGDLAKKENRKIGLTSLADSMTTPPTPAYPIANTTWPFYTTPPDTSWFNERKAAIQKSAGRDSATLLPIEKQGLDQNGIVLDTATGQYKPANTPAWIPQAQAPVQNTPPQSPPNPAARKAGVVYITPNGSAMLWTGTGWKPTTA